MRRYIIGFVLIFAFWNSSNGQIFPVKTIVENGPRENRINMVFLGDGYQINEMQKFENDVQATVDKIFSENPYNQYKSLFNIYAIEVPSNESGTNHPGTAPDCPYKDSVFFHDTYFNTTFDFGGIHRLLVAQNNTAINNVLLNNFPDYDMVMMVVNSPWYGGSGGSISVYSTNVLSAEIAIHEAGHSFAGLADEYGGTFQYKFDGINVTYQTERDLIPWNAWILSTTQLPTPPIEPTYSDVIGLFEGAYYSDVGMYRPKLHCKMRELNVPFCEVCKEQIIKSMFSYVDLIDSFQPDSTNVTLYTNDKIDFNISMLDLPDKELSVEWTLDDKIIGDNVNGIYLPGSGLSVGSHVLSVHAKHISDLVKNDPYKLLESTVSWSINVVNPTDVKEDEKIPNEFALEQNYPNPFNPTTIIKYSIPNVETTRRIVFTTLKVFDLLGREAAVLVNGEKYPGNYEITFNPADYSLPSGIYFYTLTAGSYSQTKKMLLLK